MHGLRKFSLLVIIVLVLGSTIVLAKTSKPIASRIKYVGIAKKDKYGGWEFSWVGLERVYSDTLPAELQHVVEKCGSDKGLVIACYSGFPHNYDCHFKLIDPNGVKFAESTEGYSKEKFDGSRIYASVAPCPDRNRPGYWKIVFEDDSEVTFYVPAKTRGFSVQAICGPASIIGLALIPLGILRKKKGRGS